MYTTDNITEFAQALSDHRPETIQSEGGTEHPVEYMDGSNGEIAKISVVGFEGVTAVLANGTAGPLASLMIELPEPTEDADDGETDEEYRQRVSADEAS